MLAHLLQPLLGHGLRRVVATLLQPVSVFGPDALDQLFGQARSLLTFQHVEDATHWERQLAFNLQAAPPGDEIAAQVRGVLATGAEVTRGSTGREMTTKAHNERQLTANRAATNPNAHNGTVACPILFRREYADAG